MYPWQEMYYPFEGVPIPSQEINSFLGNKYLKNIPAIKFGMRYITESG